MQVVFAHGIRVFEVCVLLLDQTHRFWHLLIGYAGTLIVSLWAFDAHAQQIYDGNKFNEFLFEPHPFAKRYDQHSRMGNNPAYISSGDYLNGATSKANPGPVGPVSNITSSSNASPPRADQLPANGEAYDQGSENLVEPLGGVLRVEVGNEDRWFLADLFQPFFDPVFGGSPTDGGFTWGWRVSYSPHQTNPHWLKPLTSRLFWIGRNATYRTSYAIEQDAITPSDIARTNGATLRPHVGHLAFNFRVAAEEEMASQWKTSHGIDATLGIVGPASGAEKSHKILHNLQDETSNPWSQINSEPIFNLGYEYGHRLLLLERAAPVNVEFHPQVGAAVGNALTYGSVGFNVRIGRNLFRDGGAPKQRQLLAGETFPQRGKYWAWSVFMGLEGRAIAHSVFLDGNTFSDSSSVDKNSFVYDAQLGFEVGYGAYRFSVMNTFRSREFKGQQSATEFVRIGMSLDI